jgi:hypothetical protein
MDSVAEKTALAHLEELLTRADVLTAQQYAGVVASHAASIQRAQLVRALRTELLRYLTAVGVVAARENAELAAQFRLPPQGVSQQALLTVARGMLERASGQKELLAKQGLSETLLDDLSATIAEFEQTLEASRAGRREHVGASADLEAISVQIAEQVRLLDGLVRYRLGKNAELMAAWASARNVLGPFKPKPVAGEGETPAGPSAIKPAA